MKLNKPSRTLAHGKQEIITELVAIMAFSPNRLILASTSPYRRALLERLGLPFQAIAPQVDESVLMGESAPGLVRRLAKMKANAVASQHQDALVIGSDQVAVLDDEILGKPGSAERAFEQLQRASGKRVSFLTGLCVMHQQTRRWEVDVVRIDVLFRELRADQIQRYLEREQPFNCAGSIKSEGLGIALFQALEGSDPTALMGLPLIRLTGMLEALGMPVF